MFSILIILVSSQVFVPIDDFAGLDAVAGPTDFGFLLVMSEDSAANEEMAETILQCVSELSLSEDEEVVLYSVSVNAPGYTEIAALAGEFNGFPAVVTLVGHCGFLELDPEFLASEIEDAWYRWGNGCTQGICNFCRRCHP